MTDTVFLEVLQTFTAEELLQGIVEITHENRIGDASVLQHEIRSGCGGSEFVHGPWLKEVVVTPQSPSAV